MMRKFMRKSLGAALLIFVAHTAAVFILGTSPVGSLVSNLLQALAGITAAIASFGAGRRSAGLARRFWTLVAVAFLI